MSAVLRGAELGLPDLEWLLVPELAVEAFREAGVSVASAYANYLRLKPGIGAYVGYELHGTANGSDSPRPVFAYTRTFRGGRAVKIARRAPARVRPTPFGPGFALLRGGRTVFFVFPNDYRLPGLDFVAEPTTLQQALEGLEDFSGKSVRVASITPVRYKPERRFIASVLLDSDDKAVAGRRIFVRFFEDGRGDRIARTASLLRGQAGSSLFPRPLGAALEGRLFVEEEVPGERIFSAILDGRADPAELAQALLGLHRSAAPVGPAVTADALVAGLSSAFDMVGAVDEGLASRGRSIVRRLEALLPARRPPVLIHGDVALHNILYSAAGPVLVDLERAAMGDPLSDLGQVVAHLRELSHKWPAAKPRLDAFAEGLVETYAGAPEVRSVEGLEFFVAVALMSRAVGAVLRRGLDKNWLPSRAPELLRLAGATVDQARPSKRTFFAGNGAPSDGLEWSVFYPQRAALWPGFVKTGSDLVTYGVYDNRSDSFAEVRPENDPALPALSDWMRRGDLVKYRVGRRATVRVPGTDQGPATYVKILPPRKLRKLVPRWEAAHRLLATVPGAPGLPDLALYRTDEGVMVFPEVAGRSLHELILEGSGDDEAAIERTAHALAAVHSVSASDLPLPPLRRPMEPHEYMGLALDHVPERAEVYRAALRVIDGLWVPPLDGDRLVHGDLHDKNVLLDGERVMLLDVDMMHSGDPVEDVGNIAAHLFLRGLQSGRHHFDRFLRSYLDAGGTVDVPRLLAIRARTLFRLSCTYLFRRRWRALTSELLQESVRSARLSRGEETADDLGFGLTSAPASVVTPVTGRT